MKIRLLLADAPSRKITPPADGAPDALVDGACPACGALPWRVRGTGRHVSADDRAYEAHAIAVCCGAAVGTIRAETGTLFGIPEDEAVLTYGRARVYDGGGR